MTDAQRDALGPALATFLERFEPRFRSAPTFGHLGTYARGLLSDLPRKTAEPIAVASGTPVRTLQEFLRDHLWDHDGLGRDVRAGVAEHLGTVTDDLGTVGLLDETSSVKKGDKTPGVSRQYLGCVGKVDDGIVTVHLGVCKGTYPALLTTDLVLPARWSDDRDRCRAAGIPDTLVHRPKWRIALDQLKRMGDEGLKLDWLVFDCEYGRCPAFLEELGDQLFVGDAPAQFRCLGARPGATDRPDPQVKGRMAEDVVRTASAFRSHPWQVVRLSRRTAEDQVWRVKSAPVWVSGENGWTRRTYRLLWLCSDTTGEEAFAVSNAPEAVPVERLVRVSFRRGHVEHLFRIAKSELGFTHFEGRNYTALMRHLSACVAMLAFVAEHTDRLRGEKSAGHRRAGVPGAEGRDPGRDAPHPPDGRPGRGARHDPVSPAPQSSGDDVQTEARRSTAHTQNTKKTQNKKKEKAFRFGEVAL